MNNKIAAVCWNGRWSMGCGYFEACIYKGLRMLNKPMDADALGDVYSNAVNLAFANKITQKNTWGLQLIDYIDQVLENDSTTLSFQRASCTLDASVKIYSYRVDSVHKDAYKILTGFAHSSTNNDNADEEDEGAEDGQERKKKRKTTKKFASTLEPASAHTTSTGTESGQVIADPLFQKTSAAFDEGGSAGLLANRLELLADGRLAFDTASATMAMEHSKKQDEENTQLTVDVSSLASLISHQSAAPLSLHLCPSIHLFEELVNSEFDSLSNAAQASDAEEDDAFNVIRDEGFKSRYDEEIPLDMDMDMTMDMDMDMGDMSFDHEPAGGAEPGMEPGQETKKSTGNKGWAQPNDDDTDALLSSLLSNVSISTKNWSGLQHWKFAKQATSTKSKNVHDDDNDDEDYTVGGRKKKKTITIDFLSTEPVAEALFAKAARSNQTLSQATLTKAENEKAEKLLPTDCKFAARAFQTLFTKPNTLVPLSVAATGMQVDSKEASPVKPVLMVAGDAEDGKELVFGTAGAVDEHEPQFGEMDMDMSMDMDYGGFGEPGEEPVGTGNDENNDPQLMTLLAAPKTAAKMNINFSTVAKSVDVRKLKGGMWDAIQTQEKEAKIENDAQEEGVGTVSFQSAMDSVVSKMPAKEATNLSVPYCFICLLHLCNEKGLELDKIDPAESPLGNFSVIQN